MVAKKNFLYEKIGEKVVECRKSQSLSQQDLADKIHVNRATISSVESGRQQTSIHLLYNIADALDVEIAYFLPSLEAFKMHKEEEANKISDLLNNADVSEKLKSNIFSLISKKTKNDK